MVEYVDFIWKHIVYMFDAIYVMFFCNQSMVNRYKPASQIECSYVSCLVGRGQGCQC